MEQQAFCHFVAVALASPIARLGDAVADGEYLVTLCLDVNAAYQWIASVDNGGNGGNDSPEVPCTTCGRAQQLGELATLLRDTLKAYPPKCILEATFRLGQDFVDSGGVSDALAASVTPYVTARAFVDAQTELPFPCECTDKPLFDDVAAHVREHGGCTTVIRMARCDCGDPQSHGHG